MFYAAALIICISAYLIASIGDVVRKRRLSVFFTNLIPLALLVIVWIAISITQHAKSFGGGPPVVPIFVMLICIILGIAGRYLFFLKGAFSWIDFLKPLAISPIVLLPLYGSVSATTELTHMQIFSFALLAYQNGFFWQAVLDRSKSKI